MACSKCRPYRFTQKPFSLYRPTFHSAGKYCGNCGKDLRPQSCSICSGSGEQQGPTSYCTQCGDVVSNTTTCFACNGSGTVSEIHVCTL